MPRLTKGALTAGRRPRKDDMIAHMHPRHLWSDCLDDTRALMSQHCWQRSCLRTVHDMKIAVTDATGGQVNQNLATFRSLNVDTLHYKVGRGRFENGS
jgi:hypothetical protein